jgi:biotin carboxylase
MPRVLILAATTGYQTRAFDDAAEQLGFELLYATDRCHVLDDPWQDRAIPIRFFDEESSVASILAVAADRAIDGVLAVGDRPTRVAARVAAALGLPWHPADGVSAARSKLATRERLLSAGLPTPWFTTMGVTAYSREVAERVRFPCVIKPLALSGSRGVMRADSEAELMAAFSRLRELLHAPDIRGDQDPNHECLLVEGFIPGREFAVEAVMNHGELQVLALFDKPDPLDGPFFEETIYVTPSTLVEHQHRRVTRAIGLAARAIGLRHGPVHAECRVNDRGVYVLEVAARPIGGLCARALRFESGPGTTISLEELLLRHSVGGSTAAWRRETDASGVMMIPIPRRGLLREVTGLNEARAVPGIEDVRITAKIDQVVLPLPEGASYLGFIFSRGVSPAHVEGALREAHRCLAFDIDPEFRVLQSRHG